MEESNNVQNSKEYKVRRTIGMIVSIIFIVSILTCSICDLAITKKFSWSLYPISSIVFVWLVIMPAIVLKRKGILVSLISCSILVIPFLYVMEQLVGNADLIMRIGLKAGGIGIPYLWIVFLTFLFIKEKFKAAAVSLLIGIPVFLIVNYRINVFLNLPSIDVWDVMTIAIMLLIVAVFFLLSRKCKSEGQQKPSQRTCSTEV